MSKLPEIFDHYSLRARLQPALITLFPLALGFIAWTGVDNFRSSALWSLCGTVGLTFLLSVVVRHRGKTIEPSLWESWGGSPTTLLLRHKGPANSVMRERWHKYLSKSVGKAFPSAVDEEKNPSAADEIYKASVRILISKTRDVKKFRLLFKENIAYGFCRNLYAMRLIGIDIAALGMLASISAAIWFRSQPIPWVCTVICALLLFAWITHITAEWVKVSGFAYAERLFEAIEPLSKTKTLQET